LWCAVRGLDGCKLDSFGAGGTNIIERHILSNATGRTLGSVRKALILGDAALKTASECSFTIRKLRFLGCFRLPDHFFIQTLKCKYCEIEVR
jgi:hypothetical protein